MAKYGKAAAKTVKSAMHRKKRGTLKSGVQPASAIVFELPSRSPCRIAVVGRQKL